MILVPSEEPNKNWLVQLSPSSTAQTLTLEGKPISEKTI